MRSTTRSEPAVLTTSVNLLLDDDGKPSSREAVLRRAFGDSYSVHEIDVTTEVMTHLDTADWRLRRAGIDLTFVPASGHLVVHSGRAARIEQSVGPISWPALISRIPDGLVRDGIRGAVWVRALLPFATSQERCDSFAVLNGDTKTVARVRWREGTVHTPQERKLPLRVHVELMRGYAGDAAKIERLLTRGARLSRTDETWVDALWALPGLGPTATERYGVRRAQAADLAVADALLGYLAEMEANTHGIVADVDTEFLHEFRVAVRRTRSVLKLLGDVLPEGLAVRMGAEFRWLGDVTTPTRDLDVYLLAIDDMAQLVHRPGGLEAFGEHVRKRRATEQRSLARSLRSTRFIELCAAWRTDLAAVMSAPTSHRQTAGQLAEQRLHRVLHKATRRAKAITHESPSEDVHALRKTCKEMRYLLEVFQPLCNPKAYKDVITDFKELQEVLGEFQDGEVQAAALREFAQEMISESSADANTLLAMGELAGQFEVRQRRARHILTERHARYLGKRASAHVDRLLKA